jgi:hypothetical protein
MRRREFVALLGSAAVWSGTARAQTENVRRIGIFVLDMDPIASSSIGRRRVTSTASSRARNQSNFRCRRQQNTSW